MGAVDLVIQVESPGAVSRGLQRIGRAGHSVGEPSKGSIYPKHRGDLLEAAVVVKRMLSGQIESTRYLRNPIDVLAQQIVAHVAARGELPVSEVAALVRRCANFAELSDEQLTNTLDLLAGRYPSEEFSELRPRVVWNRVNDTLRARDGSKRLAVTSGGTIPDRGLFGVFLPDGTRVGELDEEMVYESRPGETFVLGASTWRIEDITFQKVTVTPAPGEPGKMPFWHGDRPGRPARARAGARRVRARDPRAAAGQGPRAAARASTPSTSWRRTNLVQYIAEQAEATGVVPDDRTIVVERFRDEIGDWRVCVLSPFGTPVHAPWAMAIERRLTERYDLPVESMWGDDGIVLRLPEAADELPIEALLIEPEDIEEIVVSTLPADGVVLVAVPGVRRAGPAAAPSPARSAHPAVAAAPEGRRSAGGGGEVPDLPDPARGVARVPAGRVRRAGADARCSASCAAAACASSRSTPTSRARWPRACCSTGSPPTCTRATPRWPSAGRPRWRSTATCCATCSAPRSCASCSIPGVLADVELDLQRLSDGRRARSADELHDVLRRVGDLTRGRDRPAVRGRRRRTVGSPSCWSRSAAIEIVVAGESRFAAADDAARYRDALGCALPLGLPTAFTDPVPRPLEDLVGRYARTHGPFTEREVGQRFGIPEARRARCARGTGGRRSRRARRVPSRGRATGVVRRRGAAPAASALAGDAAAGGRAGRAGGAGPVPAGLARRAARAPRHRGRGRGARSARRGADRGVHAGARRVGVARRRLSAGTARRALHVRRGGVGRCRGDRVERRSRPHRASPISCLCWRRAGRCTTVPRARCTRPCGCCSPSAGPASGTSCKAAAPGTADDELLAALWDLVWAGEVTNDSLAPLRAVTGAVGGRSRRGAGDRARAGRVLVGHSASDRRRAPAAGASSRRCWNRRRRRPKRPTRWPCSSSSATASSPARPCWPRASSAATPRCTACSRCSRSAARCAVATS